MTDSESDDDLSNTVLRFQNQNTKFQVKGPHVNSTVMSGLSFGHSNILTSTMNGMNHLHAPTNFERPRCAESWDTRSKRDTSPLSVTSASGMPRMNPGRIRKSPGRGFGSKSVYGGRAVSPSMSMRSFWTMDSNTSAADIANAIESSKFNKLDLRVILEALCKKMKTRKNKAEEREKNRRVQKRRKARFTKIARRRISGDSGDRASNSSLSDDNDNKSVQSSRTCKGTASFRSTRTDFHTMTNSNMYNCSKTFQNHPHRSFCPTSRSCKDTLQKSYMPAYMEDRYSHTSQTNVMDSSTMSQISSITQNSRSTVSTSQKDVYNSKPSEGLNKSSTVTLKERFKNMLPAQRTNMLLSQRFKVPSTRSLPSTSTHRQVLHSDEGDTITARRDAPPIREDRDSFDQQDDIFGENTDIQVLGIEKRKRNLNCEDATFPSEKKSKLSSPKPTKSTPNKPKDFVFAKPQFPISRLSKAKNVVKKKPKPSPQKQATKSPKQTKQQQKLETCSKNQDNPKINSQIEKSSISQPVPEILISKCTQSLDESTAPIAKSKDKEQPVENDQDESVIPQNTTDVSMKPSFIKRKLFTQKIDVPDKNSSSDSLQSASPGANLYSGINKEKHKTRKIVTSQSCLSRDFLGDDSNLLDLIHKIVPPDRMNSTSATNRTEMHSTITNKSRPTDNTLSGTAATKDADISDTFTDEEIFAETIVNEKSNNETVVHTKLHNNELVNGQQKNTKTDVKTKENNNKAETNTKHDHKSNETKDTAGKNEPTYKTKKTKNDTPIKLNSTASILPKKSKKDTPIKKNGLVHKHSSSKQKSTKQTSVEKEPEINDKYEKEIVNQTSMKQQYSVKFKKNDDKNITQPVNLRQSLAKHTDVNRMPSYKDTGGAGDHDHDHSPKEHVEFRGFSQNLRRDVLRYWDSDLESDFELERRTPNKPVGGQRSHPISQDTTSTVVRNIKDAVANDGTSVIRSAQDESSQLSDKPQLRQVALDNALLLTGHHNHVKNSTEDKSRNNKTANTEVSQKNTQEKTISVTKNVKKSKANEKENVEPKNASANKPQQNKSLKDRETLPKNQQSRKNTNSKKNKVISKVNNNTLRFKSQNQTETDTLDESSDTHYLSLRSRAVDLSLNDSTTPHKIGKTNKTAKNHEKVNSKSSVKLTEKVAPKTAKNGDKTANKNTKDVISITNTSKHIEKPATKNTKTNSKPVEKTIKNSRDIEKSDAKKTAASKNNLKKLTSKEQSVLSDLSFTLTAENTFHKKSSKTKPAESFTKTRVSNISFALLKDEITKPAPVAARSNTRSQSNLSTRSEITTFNNSKRAEDESTKPAPIAARPRTRSQSNMTINRDVTTASKNKRTTSSKDITLKPAPITSIGRNNTKTNSKANWNVSREVLTLLNMSSSFLATSRKRIPARPKRFIAQD